MKQVLECTDCKSSFDHEQTGRRPIRCAPCRIENIRVVARETAKRRRAMDPNREKQTQKRYRDRNKDKTKKRNKDFYAANQEREKARAQKWRSENPEKCKEATSQWRENNKEQHKAMQEAWEAENSEYRKQYRREQYILKRDEELQKAKEWKAAKLQATPSWADEDAIKSIYAEARRLTNETGVKHHVDHIYPLQSDWVCGLHVQTNLQILTASENQSKSNRRHHTHHLQ